MSDVQSDQLSSQVKSAEKEKKLCEQATITSHRILEAFDNERRSINVVHSDLFDSRPGVVLSALSAIGGLKDPSSLKYVSRLFTHKDESMQSAAVEATGEIGHPNSYKILLDLFNTSQSEKLRRRILKNLMKIAPQEQEVSIMIREYAKSSSISPATCASAAVHLLKIQDCTLAKDILAKAQGEDIDYLYSVAESDKSIAEYIIQHGINMYPRLTARNRSLLVSIAKPFTMPGSEKILLQALGDINPGVRRSAYNVVGCGSAQSSNFDAIVKLISEQVEANPVFEEEIYPAITRMEECLKARGNGDLVNLRGKVFTQIQVLFQQLSFTDRRAISDSHELGWYIVRSKEYLEYYCDEEFKTAIVRFLKGSGNYSSEELLGQLKKSAVKVEVRHFEGYNTLVDIINDPKRTGIALIARELALTKLGKRKILYKLMRNLRLTRLFPSDRTQSDEVSTFEQIYSWAKEAKLYRLAEAALYALAKADNKKAIVACQECMSPPIDSKILTIASIHLVKELEWSSMEPVVTALLSDTEDPYILLNLIDALSNIDYPLSAEVIKILLIQFRVGKNREVIARIADMLSEKASFSVFETLQDIFHQSEGWKQNLVLAIVERMISEKKVTNRDGLNEFLYNILRKESSKNQTRAAVLLWRMGDDYSLTVLKDLILKGDIEEQVDIIRGFKGILQPDIIHIFFSPLMIDNTLIHEALRETLLSTDDEDTRKKILEMVLQCKGNLPVEGEGEDTGEEAQIQVDLFKEKRAYKFEKEYIQKLAVLFTDIQEYTKKSQILSSMELSSLIQEYELILLPVVDSHHGELIKKMGDGHLFVFQSPLNTVLAAVRLQKALKRFNSYREENFRVIIRIGIHWGKVVRKEGDVLGNTVNIASRLETAAKGGSILISDTFQKEIKDYIHSREIGLIRIKGISEPIKVFEPYEIVLDLPGELDPLKTSHTSKSSSLLQEKQIEVQNDSAIKMYKSMNQEIINYFKEAFSTLHKLCRRAEAREIEVTDIRRELVQRWDGLKHKIKGREG